MSRWAVILAGGVGSRFWPVSTPLTPKQLLPLATDEPMLVDTLARLAPLVPPERTLILPTAALGPALATMLPKVPMENLLAEPRPAGTAAALAWAAHDIARRAGRDETIVSVHSDSAILDAVAFRESLATAADAAERESVLVTVGVGPDRPDVGYGYIQPGVLVAPGVSQVVRFVEKPDRARAEAMVRDGYLWNSGIFAWRAGVFLDELGAHTPEIAPQLARHGDDLRAFFDDLTTDIAVDVGVLERTSRLRVVSGSFGWDDVGTWASLRRVRRCDAQGNALSDSAHVFESHDNVVHSDGAEIILYGVSDLVVVSGAGRTLVTTIDRAADLKRLLAMLPLELRGVA